jgi:FkbM family methyltransferase
MGESAKLRLLQALALVCRLPFMRGRVTLSERVFALLKPAYTVVLMRVGGLRVELDLSERQSRYIFFQAYERAEVSFLRSWLRPGDVALDVGAHVGFLSAVMAATVRPNGKVYALEPNPGSFRRLQRLEESSRGAIRAFSVAASDRRGPIRFFADSRTPMYSTTVPRMAGAEARAIEVPGARLDQFIRENQLGRVALVKIDVEGAELSVLEGMRGVLDEGERPTILCEVTPGLWKPQRDDPADLRACYGYATFCLGRGGRLLDVGVGDPKTPNVVFVGRPILAETGHQGRDRRSRLW